MTDSNLSAEQVRLSYEVALEAQAVALRNYELVAQRINEGEFVDVTIYEDVYNALEQADITREYFEKLL